MTTKFPVIAALLSLSNVGEYPGSSGTGHGMTDLGSFEGGFTPQEIIIVARTTNGATSPGSGKTFTVNYAFSDTAGITGVDIYKQLNSRATAMNCSLPADGGDATLKNAEFVTGKITVTGRYLYFWYSTSSFNASATLSATVSAKIVT